MSLKGDKDKSSSRKCLYVTYENITQDVSPGDRILIDDGDIELCVVDKKKDALTCEIKNDGYIKSHKGINLPSVKIKNLPSLSEKDKTFVEFAAEHDIDLSPILLSGEKRMCLPSRKF